MKHDELFEKIDPPRGGLAKLRARLDEGSSRSRWWKRALVVAPAALAVAAIVLLVLSRPQQTPDLVAAARSNGGLDEVSLGLAASPAAPVALVDDDRATAAIAEMRSSNPNVVVAWVVSTK
jgi:hypothetical protein